MEIWDLYTKDRVLTGKTITRGEEIQKDFITLQLQLVFLIQKVKC